MSKYMYTYYKLMSLKKGTWMCNMFTNIIRPPGSLPQAVPLVKQNIMLVWPKLVKQSALRRRINGASSENAEVLLKCGCVTTELRKLYNASNKNANFTCLRVFAGIVSQLPALPTWPTGVQVSLPDCS